MSGNPNHSSSSVKELIDRANLYLREGLTNRSTEELKRALEIAPDMLEIHDRLAKNYLSIGQIKESITEHSWLADYYINNTSFNHAIVHLKKILSLDSDHLEARDKLAKAYLGQGNIRNATTERMILSNKFLASNQVGKAISVYRDILHTDSRNVDVLKRLITVGESILDQKTILKDFLTLCESYIQRQAPDKAIQSFNRYIELYPNDISTREKFAEIVKKSGLVQETIDIYKQIVTACLNQGNYDLAMEICEKTLKLQPEDTSLIKWYETVKESRESVGLKLSEIQPKTETPPDEEVLTIDKRELLVQQNIASGKLDEAKQHLLFLTDEYVKSSSMDKAISTLTKITRYFPRDELAHIKLVDIFQSTSKINSLKDEYFRFANEILRDNSNGDNLQKCEEIFSKVVLLDPDDLMTYQKIIDLYQKNRVREKIFDFSLKMAQIALRQKKYDLTEQTCQKLLGMEPGNVQAREILVDLHKSKNSIPNAVEELSRLADQYLLKQSFDNAINTYKRALDLDINNVQIHKNLVVTYLQSGDTKNAVNQCIILGKLHQSHDALPEASVVFRRAIELDPEHTEAHMHLAELAEKTGAKEDAAKEYQVLAQLAAKSGDSTKAVSHLSKAIQILPDNQQFYEEIAEIHLAQNQIAQANVYLLQLADIKSTTQNIKESIPILHRIISIEPENIIAHEKLANAYESSNTPNQAAKEYTQLADIYEKQMDMENAVKYWNKALQQSPDNASIHEKLIPLYEKLKIPSSTIEHLVWLIRHYMKSNQLEQAIGFAQKILKIDPDHVESMMALSDIYTKQGDIKSSIRQLSELAVKAGSKKNFDVARSAYQQALKLQPNEPLFYEKLIDIELSSGNKTQAVEQYHRLGLLYLRLNDKGKACTVFEKALTYEPNNVFILEELSKIYVDESALNAAPTMAKLADSLWDNGQLDKALETFKSALEFNPKDETLLRSMADLQLQLGQTEEAINVLYQLAQLVLDKDQEKAIQLANEILQVDSQRLTGRLLLAEAYKKSGSKWDAIREYQVIAERYIQSNDTANAVKQYSEILGLEPDNIDVYSKLINIHESNQQMDVLIPLLHQYGKILSGKQESKPAIEVYEKITHYQPEDINARQELIILFNQINQIDKSTEQRKILADLYIKMGDYDNAISELETAKSTDMENPDIYWKLINAYEKSGKQEFLLSTYQSLAELLEKKELFTEACEIYQKILKLNPKDTVTTNKLAELYIRLNNNAQAVHQFQKLSELYHESNQLMSSITTLERAQQITPDNTELFQSLAELYMQMGNQDKAIEILMKVADLFLKEGLSANAADAYQGILSINPDYLEARMRYADLCKQANQPESASEQYYLLAQSYLKLENYPESIDALQKVLIHKPKETKIYNQIAELQIKINAIPDALKTFTDLSKHYLSEGELGLTEETYLRAIQLSPSHIPSLEGVIDILLHQKKVGEAIEHIFHLADIYQELNQSDKAIQSYRKISDLAKDNNEIHERMAEGYLRWKQTDAAIQEFQVIAEGFDKKGNLDETLKYHQRILEIDPGHLDSLQKIIDIYKSQNNIPAIIDQLMKQADILTQQRQYDMAIKLYKQVIEENPRDPKPRKALIETYKSAMQTTEASREYSSLIDLYEKLNQDQLAYQTCRDAIILDTGNAPLRERFAELANRVGQLSEAREQYIQLANLYQSQNKIEEMVKNYNRYLDSNPRDSAIRERFMDTLEQMGREDLLVDQYAAQAKLLLEDGYADQSIKYLKKPSRKYPDHIGLQLVLADAYFKKGSQKYALGVYNDIAEKMLAQKDFKQAIYPLQRLAELEPDNVDILQKLFDSAIKSKDTASVLKSSQNVIRYHLGRNDMRSAITCLESVRDLDPNQLTLREQLIDLYNRTGNHEKAILEQVSIADKFIAEENIPHAIKTLISLVQQFPTRPDIHQKLINLYLKAGQTEEAYHHYLDLSQIHEKNKQLPEMENCLKEAIQLQPENPKAHIFLVTLYRTMGKNEDALNEYRVLAQIYSSLNQWDETIRCFQQALELEPFAEDLHFALVTLYQQQGKSQELLGQYQLLSETYVQLKRYKDAIEFYQKSLDIDPKNSTIRLKLIECYLADKQPDIATEQYKILAEQYLQDNNIESAIVTYIRLSELNDKDMELRRELAQLYRRINKMHEYTSECMTLANQLLEEKRIDEAIDIFKDIMEQEPNNLHAANGLARAYVEKGDEKSALKQFLFVNQVLSTSGIGAAVDIERIKHAGIELSPKFTFDNFVVGQHSNFAHATALAVAKTPGQAYNPLFLYSDPGMGKTHLVNAIGNHIRKNIPSLKVIYTTSEDFIGELATNIQTNTIPEFRNLYRNVDVLVVEDIQFLGGKERAQEEFFHTFNALAQANKQIIITSDRPPKELESIEKRLTSRFQGGITIDIQKPDEETRLAILKQKVKNVRTTVREDVLEFLAKSIDTNVREMEGALNKLIAYHNHAKIEVTIDLAKNLLKDVFPSK